MVVGFEDLELSSLFEGAYRNGLEAKKVVITIEMDLSIIIVNGKVRVGLV